MTTWDDKIAAFWTTAGDKHPTETLDTMRSLVAQRPDDDPDALYEWASVHDYLGMEEQAVHLYRESLAQGLDGSRRAQALIQLASSLRNIGDPTSAIDLLRTHQGDESTGDAAQAFLALALRDAGHHDEALQVALTALARNLPLYSRVIEGYAQALTA